jgi:hypothetical protein
LNVSGEQFVEISAKNVFSWVGEDFFGENLSQLRALFFYIAFAEIL